MKLDFKKVMRLAALGAAGTLGMAGSGHAALYQGSWDPAFGPPFDNLGWKATANLFVEDGCRAELAQSGSQTGSQFGGRVWNAALFAGSDCSLHFGTAAVELRDVRVDFYALNAVNTVLGSFSPADFMFGSGPGSLLGVEFDSSGVPLFFATNESGRNEVVLPPGLLPIANNGCGTTFANRWFSAQLSSRPTDSGLTAYCNAQSNNDGIRSAEPPTVEVFDGATLIIFNGVPQQRNDVPEPGSFALAGLALMLAAAARRKRRDRQA